MKTLIASALLVAVCIAGGFLLIRPQTAVETRERAALKAELAAKTAALEQARLQHERSAKEKEELARLADEMGAQLAAGPASATTQPASPAGDAGTNEAGGLGKMLAKMMEDPDTKKFIRQQQRMMMDQLYSPLMAKLKLTDAEATQFKDFMADNMMKAAEKSTALLGSSSQDRAESLKALAEEQKQAEDELRVFLGEERYASYKDYQTTLGERAQLNMFRQQSGSGPDAISDDQAEQLLVIMKEEKTAMPELMAMNNDEAKLQALGSDEQVDKLIKAQEALNQRVKARAEQILPSGQMDSFSKFQTQQMDTLRLGMSMARKMFQ